MGARRKAHLIRVARIRRDEAHPVRAFQHDARTGALRAQLCAEGAHVSRGFGALDGRQLSPEHLGHDRDGVGLAVGMALRLADDLAAGLPRHDTGVARGELGVDALPEADDAHHLRHRQIGKRAVVVGAVDQQVTFAVRWLQGGEVIRANPGLALG